MCQNTPQLCWGDEWSPLSPGGRGLGLRLGRAYGSERWGGNDLIITPTLILPHQGGGKFFRELDAPQLCCGALHLIVKFKLQISKFYNTWALWKDPFCVIPVLARHSTSARRRENGNPVPEGIRTRFLLEFIPYFVTGQEWQAYLTALFYDFSKS